MEFVSAELGLERPSPCHPEQYVVTIGRADEPVSSASSASGLVRYEIIPISRRTIPGSIAASTGSTRARASCAATSVEPEGSKAL